MVLPEFGESLVEGVGQDGVLVAGGLVLAGHDPADVAQVEVAAQPDSGDPQVGADAIDAAHALTYVAAEVEGHGPSRVTARSLASTTMRVAMSRSGTFS